MDTPSKIKIDDVEYVRADNVRAMATTNIDGLTCYMVRTEKAGVFYGFLKSRSGSEAHLVAARRIFFWKGAASLSQLATEGTSRPGECKFPIAVAEITLLGVIELIPLTEAAKTSLDAVPVWKA